MSLQSRRSSVSTALKGFAAVTILSAGLASAPQLSRQAHASSFPDKPVTLIVPYRAGGGTDTMARVFAKALQSELGQPVVVVNHKGGGGAVGGSRLVNAEADGYTIMMGGDDIPTWIPLTSEVDFGFEDFRYLGAVAEYQNAMIAPVDQPYKTLTELVDYSKSNPGMKIAHQGGISQMFVERIAKQENLDWKIISSGGGAEVVQLLLGNQIDAAYSGGIHSAHPGKFEVLASLNKARLAGYPDKPTYEEAGFGLAMPAYVAFMAPAGVSDENAAILSEAILNASKDKDFVEIVQNRLSAPALSVNSSDLTDYMNNLVVSFKDFLGL